MRPPLSCTALPYRLLRLAPGLALSFVCVTSAQAETSPYYIGATASYTRDSNVFRLPGATADSIYSLGALAGFDQPIGRQRLYANGVVRNNRYQNLTQLDNTSYGLNAGLDWSTINKLSGTLSFSGSSSLINYGAGNATGTTNRNIEKSNQALASVQYGLASLVSLQGSLTHRNLTYSDPTYQANGLTQNAVSLGVNYRPSGALTLGTALRLTRGDYEGNGGSFNRRDIDFTGTWVPSGLSTINGRLSVGRQTVDGAASGRDFSGATGYLSWAYQATGRLQFTTWASRDTGAESGFFNFNGQQVRGIGDTSQIVDTLAVDSAYALTSKIRLTAGVRTARRSLVNGAQQGNDTVNGASLGASYAPLRNVLLSCSLTGERRSAAGVLSSPYSTRVAGCTAQITLQ